MHGELEALRGLLTQLGYDQSGRHPEGRQLVFVGDLVDRGPESAAVVELVAQLVAEGRAQCVLGNHELNILREDPKRDNDWFFEGTDKAIRDEIHAFLWHWSVLAYESYTLVGTSHRSRVLEPMRVGLSTSFA